LKALVKEPGEALEVAENGEASDDGESSEDVDVTSSPSENGSAENAAPVQ
jgi:hypothetical protein